MIKENQKRLILENLVESIELPSSAYEAAKKRYEDLGDWFHRDESSVRDNDPHIFPQGSFRLGTAIKPINEGESYDLDLACELKEGITKQSHSQQQLKHIVGQEIESYRKARGIKAPKKEKHRCWRLEYQDTLNFHMDIVPCIPEDEVRRNIILASMLLENKYADIANDVTQLAVSITDDRHIKYKQICHDWNISNPEGYARWFENRMKQVYVQKEFSIKAAQIDELPVFKRKLPLQRCVQLLKRHRDQMFQGDEDRKPVSVIINTLASKAYTGEQDIQTALSHILGTMGQFVNNSKPRIPNPVNPVEDFADRWATHEGIELRLEENFWLWLMQAKADFENIVSRDDISFIIKQAGQKFSTNLDESGLKTSLGLSQVTSSAPARISIKEPPARPWRKKLSC